MYLYGSFIQLRNFTAMSKKITKEERINDLLDYAAKILQTEGVEYFIGVVDRQPEAEDGGKVYTQTDIKSENMLFVLDAAFPTRDDLVQMGLWVGQMLNNRK